MRELDTNLCSLRVRKVDDPLERRDLRVHPEPRVFRADATLRYDRGRFHEDPPGSTRRETLSTRPPNDVSAWALGEGGKTSNARRCGPSANPSRDRCLS